MAQRSESGLTLFSGRAGQGRRRVSNRHFGRMLLFSHRLILYTGDFFFESCHILNDFFRSPGVYAWGRKRR